MAAHWAMGASAMAVSGVLLCLEPLFGRALLDEAFRGGRTDLFVPILAAMAVVFLLSIGFEAVGGVLLHFAREEVRAGLQRDLAAALVSGSAASSRSGKAKSEGEFLQETLGDAQDASRLLTQLPATAVSAWAQYVVILVLLAQMNGSAAAAVIVFSVLLFVLARRSTSQVARLNDLSVSAAGGIAGRLQQTHAARGLIAQYRRQGVFHSSLEADQIAAEARSGALCATEARGRGIEQLLSLAFSIGVAALTGWSVIGGKMSIGEYIAVQIFVGRIQGPVRSFLNLSRDVGKGVRRFRLVAESIASASVEQRGSLFDAPRGPLLMAAAAMPPGIAKVAQLGASFWSSEIVDGPSGLRITRGSRLLVTGPTEVELEALMDRLAGGKDVTVAGRPLTELPAAFRGAWSVRLSADPRVFPGSVRENVTLGFGVQGRAVRPQEALARVGAGDRAWALDLDAWIDPKDLTLEDRHLLQAARLFTLDPELVLVEDLSGVVGRGCFSRIAQAVYDCSQSGAKTVVLAGRREAIVDLAEEVAWVEGGRATPPQPLVDFLATDRAREMLPAGHARAVLDGRKLLDFSAHWMPRYGVDLVAYTIRFIGDARKAERHADLAAQSLRDSDLLISRGPGRLLCAFFRNVSEPHFDQGLRSRIARALSRQLAREGSRGVYPDIRRVEDRVA